MTQQNEVPARLTRAWEGIKTKDRLYVDLHGNRPDYVYQKGTRYGMVTSGTGHSKCMACQEEFKERAEAVGHPCQWETLFREITGRAREMTKAGAIEVADITARVAGVRFDDLIDTVANLRADNESLAAQVGDLSLALPKMAVEIEFLREALKAHIVGPGGMVERDIGPDEPLPEDPGDFPQVEHPAGKATDLTPPEAEVNTREPEAANAG